jgi:Uma2 family endonuclease
MVAALEHFPRLTPTEYLEWEEQQECRYEYINGEIYAMTGGTVNHGRIAANLIALMVPHLRGSGCLVQTSDVKVAVAESNDYVYPDVSISCDAVDQTATKFISQPCLIVEVLSPSTEAYDRWNKFLLYRRSAALQDYVLVSTHEIKVDLYQRNERGRWEILSYEAGDSIEFRSLNLTLPIEQIYEKHYLHPTRVISLSQQCFFRPAESQSQYSSMDGGKPMAYNNFSLQGVVEQFQLTLLDSRFCESLAPASLHPDFMAIFNQYLPLAQRAKSEKAKSELLVSPILVEVRRLANNQVELFSGEEFNVDPEQGLNGFCDFLFSRSKAPYIIQAPVIMLVEAKKGELDVGLGQCVAEMVAAQLFNLKAGKEIQTIYGCVTSGKLWQFLKLEGKDVTIDINEYYVTPVDRILGILKWMVDN